MYFFWASIKCSFSNSNSKICCYARNSFFLSNLCSAWIASNSTSSLLRLVLSLLEDDLKDLECFEEDFEEEDFEDIDFELWLRFWSWNVTVLFLLKGRYITLNLLLFYNRLLYQCISRNNLRILHTWLVGSLVIQRW